VPAFSPSFFCILLLKLAWDGDAILQVRGRGLDTGVRVCLCAWKGRGCVGGWVGGVLPGGVPSSPQTVKRARQARRDERHSKPALARIATHSRAGAHLFEDPDCITARLNVETLEQLRVELVCVGDEVCPDIALIIGLGVPAAPQDHRFLTRNSAITAMCRIVGFGNAPG
jgi:hypothetical protein